MGIEYYAGLKTLQVGFVTWPPFSSCTIIFYKGGQVTKPIIVVKMPGCKVL